MSARVVAIVAVLATAAIAHAKIPEPEAVRLATEAAGGFLGTWVDTLYVAPHWYVSARSKSARPPCIYVVDGETGATLLRVPNSDDATLLGTAHRDGKSTTLQLAPGLVVHVAASLPDALVDRRVVAKGGLHVQHDAGAELVLTGARLTAAR